MKYPHSSNYTLHTLTLMFPLFDTDTLHTLTLMFPVLTATTIFKLIHIFSIPITGWLAYQSLNKLEWWTITHSHPFSMSLPATIHQLVSPSLRTVRDWAASPVVPSSHSTLYTVHSVHTVRSVHCCTLMCPAHTLHSTLYTVVYTPVHCCTLHCCTLL